LVLGYLNNSIILIYFGNYLKRANLGSIYTINLKNPFRSIEEYSKKVKERIDELFKEGIKEVDLVGHSMGGLVCLYFALKCEYKVKLKKIVCIGTPFEGTKTAFYGFGKCAKQMRYHSLFVKKLKRDILEDKRFKIYCVATKLDQIVIPFDSAILEKKENLVINDLGHASLIFSKRVAKRAALWLKIN
jgi:triacylglycerol esterase/lipase EstA (alpha/beta hydrolase family)